MAFHIRILSWALSYIHSKEDFLARTRMTKCKQLVIRYWALKQSVDNFEHATEVERQASIIVIQTSMSQVNLNAFSQFTELLIVYQINKENVKVSQ